MLIVAAWLAALQDPAPDRRDSTAYLRIDLPEGWRVSALPDEDEGPLFRRTVDHECKAAVHQVKIGRRDGSSTVDVHVELHDSGTADESGVWIDLLTHLLKKGWWGPKSKTAPEVRRAGGKALIVFATAESRLAAWMTGPTTLVYLEYSAKADAAAILDAYVKRYPPSMSEAEIGLDSETFFHRSAERQLRIAADPAREDFRRTVAFTQFMAFSFSGAGDETLRGLVKSTSAVLDEKAPSALSAWWEAYGKQPASQWLTTFADRVVEAMLKEEDPKKFRDLSWGLRLHPALFNLPPSDRVKDAERMPRAKGHLQEWWKASKGQTYNVWRKAAFEAWMKEMNDCAGDSKRVGEVETILKELRDAAKGRGGKAKELPGTEVGNTPEALNAAVEKWRLWWEANEDTYEPFLKEERFPSIFGD